MSSLNQCTYDVSGPCAILQYYRLCYTCSENQPSFVAVCLNCASICHEEHSLGPVVREPFYCRCFENDSHICRASRAAQSHIHRRRAQDAKFKALQQQLSRNSMPLYASTASSASRSSKAYDKKFVVWYRTDNQPKSIVKVFEDIDEANDCVKDAFVEYNPWEFSSLELRRYDTFQSVFSSAGLAQYSVSLRQRTTASTASKTSTSPVDLAKAGGDDIAPNGEVGITSTVSERILVEDKTLLEKGSHWEVHAEMLEQFLQDYGCEPPPVMPTIIPANIQPVAWYDFPEPDPFEDTLPRSLSASKKSSSKKKTSSAVTMTMDMHDDVHLPLKKAGGAHSAAKKQKKTQGTTSSTPAGSSSKKKTSKKAKASAIADDDYGYFRLPAASRKRGRPSATQQEESEATPARKSRVLKEEGAPKGPSASFMFFTNVQRPIVRQEHPKLSVIDVTRHIGELWRNLTTEEKAPFEELAKEDRLRYAREKAEFLEQKKGAVNEESSSAATAAIAADAASPLDVVALNDSAVADEESGAIRDGAFTVHGRVLEEGEEEDVFAVDDDEEEEDGDDDEGEEEEVEDDVDVEEVGHDDSSMDVDDAEGDDESASHVAENIEDSSFDSNEELNEANNFTKRVRPF